MKNILAKLFRGAAQEVLSKNAFKYGWCTTDYKDGKDRSHRKDYLNDKPYATRVRAMLKQLGLPFPERKEIFRGAQHDLLFLNNHGVVLRIGPLDVEDLMNPAIVQPLGWLEDKNVLIETKKVPLTVAIYPGIELYSHWQEHSKNIKSAGDLRVIFNATMQGNGDLHANNIGIIRVLDDSGEEMAVEVLLDPDNKFSSSSQKLSEQRASHMAQWEKSLDNKGDVISQTLQSSFDAFCAERIKTLTDDKGNVSPGSSRTVDVMKNLKYWQRAFEAHQPLRRLFWEVFKNEKAGDMPDTAARDAFWERCARVTNNPQAATMPVWHSTVDADGKTVFTREEICVPHVVLYRPWTGEAADQAIRAINVTPAVRAAIAKEHARLIQRDEQVKPKKQQMDF